jgi:hypothetical protein
MIKAISKLEIEGMYLNIIKVSDKLIANIILNGEKWKPCPLKSGMRKVSSLPSPSQHSPRIPSQSNKARRRKKKEYK